MQEHRWLMGWWRRFEDAEWPDGKSWPEGMPSPDFSSWWWRAGSLIASIAAVLIMLGLSELGLPFWIAFPVAVLVAFSPLIILSIRSIHREARKQGWKRNVYGN